MRLMCMRIEIDMERWIIVLIVLRMKGVERRKRESFWRCEEMFRGT